MHYFKSVVTYNTINFMHVCMYTTVPAAHCAMMYYVVHNNYQLLQSKESRAWFPTRDSNISLRDHMGSITGSLLFFNNNHQLMHLSAKILYIIQ